MSNRNPDYAIRPMTRNDLSRFENALSSAADWLEATYRKASEGILSDVFMYTDTANQIRIRLLNNEPGILDENVMIVLGPKPAPIARIGLYNHILEELTVMNLEGDSPVFKYVPDDPRRMGFIIYRNIYLWVDITDTKPYVS